MKQTKVSAEHAKDIWRSLEKDVLPAIENIPVQEIKARALIQALEPIKARGALETVRRLVQRINEIMVYAVDTGLIGANPALALVWPLNALKSSICRLSSQNNSLSMPNLSLPTRCLIE